MTNKCPVCGSPIQETQFVASSTGTLIHCRLCGDFLVFESFLVKHGMLPITDSYLCSGALREHASKGKCYELKNLNELLDSVSIPLEAADKIDKFLIAISRKQQYFGEFISLDPDYDYPFAYAIHKDEFYRLVVAAYKSGFIEPPENQSFTVVGFYLTVAGANRVAELKKGLVDSGTAFVAMWFDPQMDSAWTDGIKPALDFTNYDGILIKEKEHNNKIDDEIVAAIRKSGLLIADVSGHRPAVYFEAGLAMGLRIPVIWTCRQEDIAAAHFDTRQYNHIVWTDESDLQKKLIHRIEATVPRLS